jgi:hypothetical protein
VDADQSSELHDDNPFWLPFSTGRGCGLWFVGNHTQLGEVTR